MARISVVGTPFEKVLLQDLDKKQSLREHTINPPGQERYIRPIDEDALKTFFEENTSATPTDAEIANLISGTVGDGSGSSGTGDDIGDANLETAAGDLTGYGAGEISGLEDELRDILSYRLIETGQFLLSFDGGVVKGLLGKSWVKVFVDDGTGLFSL